MSWLEDDADDEDEFDETTLRARPNPKANRPRTKRRPAHADAVIARVLGVDRGRYTVLADEDGPDERRVLATRARELRRMQIVTGDRARIVGDQTGSEGTLARIIGIEERTSLLRRSADDTDQVERVIVANADQMLIVVAAADPEPRERLVDRYLVAALDAGVRPLLVVTKTDLADPSEFLAHFEGLDLEVFTSAQQEMPLERIGAQLVGHSTVFVGHSGVGKSTLVNALVPSAMRATGHVNEVTGRGRHTSSSTVSLRYRGDGGNGWVIDTPGVRSFGLGHVDPANILGAFTELAQIAEECPRGCTHLPDAPDCAIIEAAAEGRLGPNGAARLDSLQRLLLDFRRPALSGIRRPYPGAMSSVALEPGTPAPEFTLLDQDEKSVSLSDLRGTGVVLFFYPEAMTPGCTTEACDFRDSLAPLQAAGYTVLGISPDQPEKLRRFRERDGLTYDLLSDPDHAALDAYGTWGEKTNYGKTYQGVIRSTFVIDPEGRVQHALYNVKATGHVARVRTLLGLDA